MNCPNDLITRDSLSVLYKTHAKELMVFANSILRNPDDASEVVHDLFCTLYEKVPEKNLFQTTIRAFLFVSVKNRSLNLIQKNRKKTFLVEDIQAADQQFDRIDDRITGEIILAHIQTNFAHAQVEIFNLRVTHSLTWQEISDITGIALTSAYREFESIITQLKKKFPDVF